MTIRFVTKTIHAYLDYPVAATLILTPFLLGLGQDGPVAVWLSVVTGVAALLLTLVTDHETGVVPLVPYAVHLWVDRVVGAVFLVAPSVLGFTGVTAAYYSANGLAVLLVTVVLSATATRPGSIVPARA